MALIRPFLVIHRFVPVSLFMEAEVGSKRHQLQCGNLSDVKQNQLYTHVLIYINVVYTYTIYIYVLSDALLRRIRGVYDL